MDLLPLLKSESIAAVRCAMKVAGTMKAFHVFAKFFSHHVPMSAAMGAGGIYDACVCCSRQHSIAVIPLNHLLSIVNDTHAYKIC